MRLAVLGAGAVGARALRQLAATPEVSGLTVADRDGDRARQVAASMAEGSRVRTSPAGGRWWDGAGVAVLASPSGDHAALARRLIDDGVSVVSVSGGMADVRDLLALGARAADRGRTVVVGAGFAPGLSCLLAAFGASGLDAVDEVHVARTGVGGPACAGDWRRSLGGDALDWRDGRWTAVPKGGRRQLCWFPEPVGALDCQPAALADPLVLVPAFPGAERVTGRSAANRRDRLRPRLAGRGRRGGEGQLGAIRVEVRGRRRQTRETIVLGAVDRPAVAAGAVAALAALATAGNRLSRPGAGGLAEMVPAPELLIELARRGVKAAILERHDAAVDRSLQAHHP